MKRPLQPNKKSGLSPGAVISVACMWVVALGILAFVILYTARERQVTEWLVSNAPTFAAFVLPSPPEEYKQPALTGVIGLVPGIKYTTPVKEPPPPANTPAATPVQPASTPGSTTYDECAVWGRDTVGRVNCEDHKQKVQSYIQSAQERDAISEEALEKKTATDVKDGDIKKDSKKSTKSRSTKKKDADKAKAD